MDLRRRAGLGLDGERVEELRVHEPVPQPLEGGGEQRGVRVDARRDARDALGSVVHGVHARGHRQQHLRRADVAGRLLAADVLLARLQRHAQRQAARRVPGDADDRKSTRLNSSHVEISYAVFCLKKKKKSKKIFYTKNKKKKNK